MFQNNATTKRNAFDDETDAQANGVMNTTSMTATSNPLLNAAKKAKRESKTGASNKRKLANAEEAPGGLFIVRTQAPPSSSLPTPAATTTTTKPPAKKFKSSQPSPHPQSQPLPSTTTKPPSASKSSLLSLSQPTTLTRYNTPDADPALDAAVRAMDTEAADLRRLSRVPQTPNVSGSGSNSKFRFTTQSVTKNGSGDGIGKRRETIIDTSAPLHTEEDETPQIQRNKRLRAGAMAAISSGGSSTHPNNMDMDVEMTADPMTPPRKPGQSAPGSTRRKSSVGARGKRISNAFEATGIITQPHNSVADTSFYKHIDSDLSDSDRIRQLLIWCSARAASTIPSPSLLSSSDSSSSSTSPPDPPLPKLPATAETALKSMHEDIVRRLAERRVDLSLFGGPEENENVPGDMNVKLAENKQNVTNRMWEGVYNEHIRSAEEEEEAWKKVSYAYDTYARRVRSNIEKRRTDLGIPNPTTTSSPIPTPVESSSSIPSAKVQGKQRAPSLEPHERDLPLSFQAGFRLARKVLSRSRARRKALDLGPDHEGDQTPGAGPSTGIGTGTRKGVDPENRPLPTSSQGYDIDVEMEAEGMKEKEKETEAEMEAEAEADRVLRERMKDVEFKLDHLYVMASQARQTTEVAQMALDARFEVLARALDARRRVHPHSSGASVAGSGTATSETPSSVLGRYVGIGAGGGGGVGVGVGVGGGGGGGGGTRDREEADEALALLRALARVDAARPPAQVGDAARRAVREVQRVGDASERRITEVPVGSGVGLTPRKVPGTPRRGTTPGR